MGTTIQISPETYQLLQRRAKEAQSTPEQIAETAIRLQFGNTIHIEQKQTPFGPQAYLRNTRVAVRHVAAFLKAGRSVEEIIQTGLPHLVPMDVDEWLAWCQQHDQPLTGASRSQYTSRKASAGSDLSPPPGQFVSRRIKPHRNPIPFLDKLETLFETERDKSSPPPYPFDPDRNLIRLPQEVEDHLRQLARTGQKIEAVKQVTRLTGAGLRVAKDYVDGLIV